MTETPTTSKAVQKYTNDTLTEEQFNEIMQTGSIQSLTNSQRSSYLYWLSKHLGLNPYTKPFDIIPGEKGKLIIYANRTASDQLRQRDQLTDRIVYEGPLRLGEGKIREDVYQVVVELVDNRPSDRLELRRGIGMGLVGIDNAVGEGLAIAIMKCHTKALRRATLAFCGLGFPDETEVEAFATGAPASADVIEATATPIEPGPAPTPKVLTGKLPSAKVLDHPTAKANPLPAAKPPATIK